MSNALMDEIVVGTYEGFLLGYSLTDGDEVKKLKQTFATQSHTASVRCVSIAGKFLASGGTDDKVVIIDMKHRKEHTVLMNHDGTINTVAFTHGGTHLLTGSDDGKIIVTRTGNWQIEKIWRKAHGGQPVTDLCIHPSDKLALSIGGDKTLRTWNLVKGRPAFTMNLGSKGVTLPTEIMFAPGGDRFSLISQQNVDVWTISKAGMEKRITCQSKPCTVRWIDDEKFMVGLDNGNVIFMNIYESQARTYHLYKQRVKCLYYENKNLYSASSSGELKIWSVTDENISEICSANTGCRVTCLTLNKQRDLIKKEEKSVDEDLKESNESSENDDEHIEKENTDDESKEAILPVKRKPSAFVTIQYDSDKEKAQPPPNKKSKKRRKNKKKLNNKTDH